MSVAGQPAISRKISLEQAYIAFISSSGALLLIWAAWSIRHHSALSSLILLSGLAALAMIVPTAYQFGRAEMVYEVGSAVVLATVPHFGMAGALIAVATSTSAFWLLTVYRNGLEGRRYLLLFNLGMQGIAISAAALIYQALLPLLPGIIGATLTWVVTAVVFDQVNVWLLVCTIYFRNNRKTALFEFWKENIWAMVLNITILMLGGGILVYSMSAYGLFSVAVFFLPILLSALAFQLYSSKIKENVAELERLVAERTNDLVVSNAELRQVVAQLSESDRDKEAANTLLLAANRRLVEVDQAKDRFLAVLSHDMRSPLTGIMLYGQMLQKQPNIPLDKRQRMHNVILQNAQVLVDLVDDVVEAERMTAKEVSLSREFFDLTEVGEQVISSFEAHATQKQIGLHFHSAEKPHVVEADKQFIKRVVANLVSNAVKYTPKGGRVKLNLYRAENGTVIDVVDTGYGIPSEALPYIFDSYHRIATHQDKAKGLGLGLSIVKHYVEAHGGEIFVESAIDKGSCFRVTLPI